MAIWKAWENAYWPEGVSDGDSLSEASFPLVSDVVALASEGDDWLAAVLALSLF